jgi:hypothetical protein
VSMPTPQTHVRYYRTEAGGIGMVEESHPGSTRLPAGAVELDKAAYDAATAEWLLPLELVEPVEARQPARGRPRPPHRRL